LYYILNVGSNTAWRLAVKDSCRYGACAQLRQFSSTNSDNFLR